MYNREYNKNLKSEEVFFKKMKTNKLGKYIILKHK